jgi:hypothetical protein
MNAATSGHRWLDVDKQTDRAPRAWPRYMTARVAADYSDTSPWTVRRNVKPCGRRGRSFVYAIESVEAWMRGTALNVPTPETTTPRFRIGGA